MSITKAGTTSVGSGLAQDFDIAVESAGPSPSWDAFVAVTSGGHHAQTSLWGEVKRALGWDAFRLIMRNDNQIVGGMQLLTKRVRGIRGRVGFAPRGPLLGKEDDRLLPALNSALMALAKTQRVRYLKTQPPIDRPDMVPALERLGWTRSSLEAAPTASLRIDLAQSEDHLLKNMRATTRQRVRQGPRRGLHIRVGDERDLPAFYRIVAATSRRRGFAPYPAIYYETMFRMFSTLDGARLLVAQIDEQVLAAVLLIAFGDTVTYKMGGWSGDRHSISPNAPTQWEAIRWSKEAGYRWYDFDGIPLPAAMALRQHANTHIPRGGVLEFKLGFGGEVEVFPAALDSTPYASLRPIVRVAARHAGRALPLAHRVIGRQGG